MQTHDRQKRRWLIEFGIVSLVPVIVLGLVVAHSMRSSIRDRALDTAKAEALGWAPRRDFSILLAATVDWYAAHEDWWRPIKERTEIITWAEARGATEDRRRR